MLLDCSFSIPWLARLLDLGLFRQTNQLISISLSKLGVSVWPLEDIMAVSNEVRWVK